MVTDPSGGLSLQRDQHFFRVTLGLDLGEHVRDPTLRINEERGAFDAHNLLAIHVLLFDHIEGLSHLLVRVGEQRERQVILLLKLLQRCGLIGRNAQNYRAGFLYLAVCVAEPARLDSSPWRVSFGEEVHHHVLSAIIF